MPDYHKNGVIVQGSSVGEEDSVVMGDLTGDGRADFMIYLYLADNGVASMGENRGLDQPDWHTPRLFAAVRSVGVLGSEVQFANTDGDGLWTLSL